MMTKKLSEYGQAVLVALLFSLLVFVIADFVTGDNQVSRGKVVDKHYQEARTYVTLQTRTDSKGHSYSTPVVHHDPPEWTLFVQTASGDVVRIHCRPDIYYSKQVGDPLEFITRFGGISHFPYLRKALKTTEGY